MPINSSISISHAVGRGGRNLRADVMTVQNRLNQLMHPPKIKLVVDGHAGPKTEAMIADFQRIVLGQPRQDARVDSTGATIRALNDAASEGKWARMSMMPSTGWSGPFPGAADLTPALAANRGQQLLAQEAALQRTPSTFDEIRRALIDTGFPPFKSFLGSVTKADEARNIITTWKAIRGFGFSAVEAAELYRDISKMNVSKAKDFFELAAKSGTKFAAALGKFAKLADKVALIITAIEVADKMEQGDYLYGTTEIYKRVMGAAVPWAGAIDAMQSVVEGILPASAKNSAVFKVMRSCDPVGLGAVGVDTISSFAVGLTELALKGRFDLTRLDRLADRMRAGPTAFFAQIGGNLGTSIYEMSKWDSDDWGEALKAYPGFLADTVLNPILKPLNLSPEALNKLR